MTMNAVFASTESYHSAHVRRLLLGIAMLCIVAGSQIGMLILTEIYLTEDRAESRVSPEAIVGLAAIALALFVMRVHSNARYERDLTWIWLLAFLSVASFGELIRPDLRLGNVSTFISIGAFYLVGSAMGRDIQQPAERITLVPALLCLYTLWYVWILALLLRGDLGFYGRLPDSQLLRLEFRQGFTSTELAIYLGLQLPILIYSIITSRSWGLKLWSVLLTGLALMLIIATMSAAALAASALVVVIFLVARRGLSFRACLRAVIVLSALVAIAMLTSQGLVDSVRAKLENFAAGEGVRALIYAELVADIIENPLGIGKGRFVETNNFSWLGEGLYPHQNILGIGAELGLPAMLLYVAFLITAVVRLCRAAFSRGSSWPPGIRIIAATVLAVFAFQQFRGLFQDTWVIRETYFWLGFGLGAVSLKASSRPSASRTLHT